MIQVGATIGGAHLFIEVYPQAGEMTTGRIAGEGVNGINTEFPTIKFKKTGGHGNGISTGRNKIIGVSKKRTKRDHDNNSNNNEAMIEEEIKKNKIS
jgi:hypothetical protein